MKAFTIILLLAGSLLAQPFKIEASSPRYGVDQRGLSGIYLIEVKTGDWTFNSGIARLDVAGLSGTSLANPKASFSVGDPISKATITYSLTLPITSYRNSARAFGVFAQSDEHLENWLADALAVGGSFGWKYPNVHGLSLALDFGTTMFIALKRTSLADRGNFAFPFALSIKDVKNNFIFGAAVAGNYLATHNTETDFADNFRAQLKLFAGYRLKPIEFQAFLKMPLDKVSDTFLRNTVGLQATF